VYFFTLDGILIFATATPLLSFALYVLPFILNLTVPPL